MNRAARLVIIMKEADELPTTCSNARPVLTKHPSTMTAMPIGNLLALFEANIAKSGEVVWHDVHRTEVKRAAKEERKTRIIDSEQTKKDWQGHNDKPSRSKANKETKNIRSIVREKIRLFERRPLRRYNKNGGDNENHTLQKQEEDTASKSGPLSSSSSSSLGAANSVSSLHSPEQMWTDVSREQHSNLNNLPADLITTPFLESPSKYKRRRGVLRHAPALPAEPDLRANREDVPLPSLSNTTIPRIREKSASISSLDDSEYSKQTHRERKKKKGSPKKKDIAEESEGHQKSPQHNASPPPLGGPIGRVEEYLQKKNGKKKKSRRDGSEDRSVRSEEGSSAKSIQSGELSIRSGQLSTTDRHDEPSPPAWTPIGKVKVPEYLKRNNSRRKYSRKQSSEDQQSDDESRAASVQSNDFSARSYDTKSTRGDNDDSSPPAWAPTRKVKLPEFLKKGSPSKKMSSRRNLDDLPSNSERSLMSASYEANLQTFPVETTKPAPVGKVEVPETFKKGRRLPDTFKHILRSSSHRSQNWIPPPRNTSQAQMEEQTMSDSSESTFTGDSSSCRNNERGNVRVSEKFRVDKTPEQRRACSREMVSKVLSRKMEKHVSLLPKGKVLSTKLPAVSLDRDTNHDTQHSVSGRLFQRRSSLPTTFVRPVTPERRIARRASTGRLRIDDIRDARHWDLNMTHAVQITQMKDMLNLESEDTESRARLAPPRRMVRRHSTGSLSARSNETDDMMVDFWHTYESDDSRSPEEPIKKTFSRRRSVRFDSSVTVWIFTKDDTPFECDLQLPQSFVPSNTALDTAPKPPRRIDTAPKAPIRRTNSNDKKPLAISRRFDSNMQLPSNLELSKPSRKPSGDELVDMPGIVFCAANSDSAPKAPRRLEMMESINESFRQLCNHEAKERERREVDLMPCQPRRRCSLSSHTGGDDSAAEDWALSPNTSAGTVNPETPPSLIPTPGLEESGLQTSIAPRNIAIGPMRWDSSDRLDPQNVLAKDFEEDAMDVNDSTEVFRIGPSRWDSSDFLKLGDSSSDQHYLGPPLLSTPGSFEASNSQETNLANEDRLTLEDDENLLSSSRIGISRADMSRGFGTRRWDSLKDLTSEGRRPADVSVSPRPYAFKRSDSFKRPGGKRWYSKSKVDREHLELSDRNRDVPSRLDSTERLSANEIGSENGVSLHLIGNSDLPSRPDQRRNYLGLVVGPSRWDSTCNFDEQKDVTEDFPSEELSTIHEQGNGVGHTEVGLRAQRWDSVRCLANNCSITPEVPEFDRVDSSRSLLTNEVIFELEEETDHSETSDAPEEKLIFLPSSFVRPIASNGSFLKSSRDRWDSTRSLVANDTIFEEDESERSLVADDKEYEKVLTAPMVPVPVFSVPPMNLRGNSKTGFPRAERWDSSESLIANDVISEVDLTQTSEATSLSGFRFGSQQADSFKGIGVDRSDSTRSGFKTEETPWDDTSSRSSSISTFRFRTRRGRSFGYVCTDHGDSATSGLTAEDLQADDISSKGSGISSFQPRVSRGRAELWDSTSSLTTDDLRDVTLGAGKNSFANRYDSTRSLTTDDIDLHGVAPSVRENSFANRYDSTRSLTTDDIPDDTSLRKILLTVNQGDSVMSLNLGDIAGDESLSIQSSVSYLRPGHAMGVSILSLDMEWPADPNRSVAGNESIIDNMPRLDTSVSGSSTRKRCLPTRTFSSDSGHLNTLRPRKWRGDSTRTLMSRDNSDRSLKDKSFVSRQSSGRNLVRRNNSGRCFVDRSRSSEGLIARNDSGVSTAMIREPSDRGLLGRSNSGISLLSREDSNRSLVSGTCSKVFRHRLQPYRAPSFAKRPDNWRGDSIQNLSTLEDSIVNGGPPSLLDATPSSDAHIDSTVECS
eukprot:scaffold2524_cov159-Amphora_coffeaeformis.AAC.1